MFLSEKDIADLTNKSQHSAQARVLNTMGVVYRQRSDGSLAVLVAHIEKLFDGKLPAIKKEAEPMLDSINA